MNPGQILEVLSTDPNVLRNFPRVLERSGDRVIHMKKDDDYFHIYVQRIPKEEVTSTIASREGAT